MHDQPVSGTAPEYRQLLIGALPDLRAYARALTRSRDQADDLVQDTALRLLAAQEQFHYGTNFRAWAIAALRNRFIDLRRHARIRATVTPDLEALACSNAPMQDKAVYLDETARKFWCLPAMYREVLMLIGVNGLSYEQVAKMLGYPIGTIRSRLARARAALEAAVDGEAVASEEPVRSATRIRPVRRRCRKESFSATQALSVPAKDSANDFARVG